MHQGTEHEAGFGVTKSALGMVARSFIEHAGGGVDITGYRAVRMENPRAAVEGRDWKSGLRDASMIAT